MPTRRSFASLAAEEDTKKNEKPLKALLDKCKGKTFSQFWDILGRPWKNGKQLGVLQYQTRLTDILESGQRHLLLCKSVGCGGTEYFLRWLLFRIMTNDQWQNRQCPIVVGPSQNLADRILSRIRRQLEFKHGILFDSAKNWVTINKCELFSVPSHNINSLRSLEDVACILVSEADFMPGEINEIREVSERYISKSDPYIILESTINNNTGLFASVFKENPSLYQREVVKYTDAPEMYAEKSVLKMRQSRSFDREMLCDFSAAAIGNTFPAEWVDNAFTNYNPNILPQPHEFVLAIDPGWSPARTGVTLIGKNHNDMKIVITSDEYVESEDSMLDLIIKLSQAYNIKNIYVDAADKRFIKRIKRSIGERDDYEEYIKFLKENKILSQYNPLKNSMRVIPLLFTQNSSAEMLSYTRLCLEQGSVMIPSNCSKLQSALFSAQDTDGQLLKSQLSHGSGGDCLDSFRMALWGVDN